MFFSTFVDRKKRKINEGGNNFGPMVTHETKILTRYGETDRMGVIFHANYIIYYEIARTEMLKDLGDYSYKAMEEDGIMMPVVEIRSNYVKPAYYDEELTVRTTLEEMPRSKITFRYEVFNQRNELINTGVAVLAFMKADTRIPSRPPARLLKLLQPHFNSVSKNKI